MKPPEMLTSPKAARCFHGFIQLQHQEEGGVGGTQRAPPVLAARPGLCDSNRGGEHHARVWHLLQGGLGLMALLEGEMITLKYQVWSSLLPAPQRWLCRRSRTHLLRHAGRRLRLFSQLMSGLERLPRSDAGGGNVAEGQPAAAATAACAWARLGPVPMGRFLDLQPSTGGFPGMSCCSGAWEEQQHHWVMP